MVSFQSNIRDTWTDHKGRMEFITLLKVTMFSQVIVPTMEKIKLEAIENSLFELS